MDEAQLHSATVTAPPPPSEVKIRTMKSDVAMFSASGGGLPRFENVKVAGIADARARIAETPANAAKAESKSNLALIVVLVIAVVALAVVGFFVYLKLKG